MVSKRKWIRWAFATVIAIIAVFGAALVRVAVAPVSVEYFRQFIETPIQQTFPDATVTFTDPRLLWNWDAGTVDLSLRDVAIRDPVSGIDADLPEVSIAISGMALLNGMVAPERVDLTGARMTAEWSREDATTWFARSNNEPQEDPGAPRPPDLPVETTDGAGSGIPQLVRRFLTPPDHADRLGFIKRVRLRRIDIDLIERESGVEWRLPQAEIEFIRSGARFIINGSIQLVAKTSEPRLHISTENLAAAGTRVLVTAEGVNFGRLACEVGISEGWLPALDASLGGEFDTVVDRDGQLQSLQFSVSGPDARIVLPESLPAGPTFEQFEISGGYRASDRSFRVDSLFATLESGSLSANGLVLLSRGGARPHLRAEISLNDLPVRTLLRYWPREWVQGVYRWLDNNMPQGQLREAVVTLNLRPEYWQRKPLPDDALRLTYSVENGVSYYIRGMPPLANWSGEGILTPDHMDLAITKGTIDNLPVTGGRFEIVDLSRGRDAVGHVSVDLESSIPELLRLIDHEPLGYPSKYGIDPDALAGHAKTHGYFVVPLRSGIGLNDVGITVESHTDGLTVPQLFSDGGLTHGNLDISVTKHGLAARGSVALKDIPFNLYWTEKFGPREEGELPSSFDLTGALSGEELERFGIPASRQVKGRVWAALQLQGNGPRLVRGTGQIDFFESPVSARKLSWDKPAHEPGEAEFSLEWADDGLHVNDFQIDSGGFKATGDISFDRESGAIKRVDLRRVWTEGGHDLTLLGDRGEDGVLELAISAKHFDARPFIQDILTDRKSGADTPMRIALFADTAEAYNGVEIHNLELTAETLGGYWPHADATGVFSDGADLQVAMRPSDDGRSLSISTANGGMLTLGAGIFMNGEGGNFDLEASMGGQGDERPMVGTVKASNFRIVPSQRLVAALAAREGRDVDSYLGEDELDFDKLDLNFSVDDGIIDIDEAQANGDSIGFTLRGQLDQKDQRVAVSGIIVPLYGLNALLGNLPIIGALLTGGDGGGMFAVTYKIEGPTDEPEITVNPFSAFAPGILRRFVEEPKGRVERKPGEASQSESNEPDEESGGDTSPPADDSRNPSNR